MTPRNPFTVGQPISPEHFIGRSVAIATAFDQILSRSNLAVWSGSGMGKTSFLDLLASPEVWRLQGLNPSLAVIVYINCLSINPFQPNQFWKKILNSIKEDLEENDELQSKLEVLIAEEVNKDSLRQVLKQLGKQNKTLVLLIDDYDAALRTHEQYSEVDIQNFLSECRNLAYHSKERKYLSMILTSSRRLNEIGPDLSPEVSPWYNHYLFQPLKPFTESEVASLLGGMPMKPELKEGIREIAGGHPALLQNAGYLLFNKLRAGQETNIQEFAWEFLAQTEHFFQDTWNFSNETEQILLILIALSKLQGRLQKKRYDLGDITILFSQRERELLDLEERGVIKRTIEGEQAVYMFTSSMMEWWVIKEIENSDEESLTKREKVLLNLMSHKQLEQFKIVVRTLWEHRDDFQSAAKWLGKLAGAIPKGFLES